MMSEQIHAHIHQVDLAGILERGKKIDHLLNLGMEPTAIRKRLNIGRTQYYRACELSGISGKVRNDD